MSGPGGCVHRPSEADEQPTAEGCAILESWNRTMDPAVSIARARVAPGETTRWHRLRGVVERYLILAGEGEVELGGSAPVRVGPGDVVFIPTDCDQRIRSLGAIDLCFLAICTPRFTPDCYQDTDPLLLGEAYTGG